MAVPTNTIQAVDLVGNREDLHDSISQISPHETPFCSLIGEGKAAKASYVEFQKSALAAASGDNKTVQGDDATNDLISQPTKLGNHCQLMDKVAQVSSTADAVNTAGRKKELARAIANKSLELKRDKETRMTGNYASVAAADAVAGECGGFEAWIETNEDRGATGASGGFNTGTNIVDAATDGTQRAVTETMLKGVLKSAWEQGGDPSVIMAGGFNKQALSGFTGIATQYKENNGMKHAAILGAAGVYISDFGNHRIVANRFQRDRSVLCVDPKTWSLRSLQRSKIEKLAKTGHSERRMISQEVTLQCSNEAANGIIADLLTA